MTDEVILSVLESCEQAENDWRSENVRWGLSKRAHTAGAAAVAKHSMRFMRLYASAGFVVICDNFLPVASCKKRNETKVIQLWHACGCYKKFGYDAKDDIPVDYHGGNVYRNADLVTVSGEAAVRPFASAMRLPADCVKPLGVSRTDLYLQSSWAGRCREKFYEEYPEAHEKRIVLWAPSFRGNAGVPELLPLDLDQLQRDLGEDYLVLARLHPHMLNAMRKETTAVQSNVTGRLSTAGQANAEGRLNAMDQAADLEKYLCRIPTEELYPVVDVLIADYSSLIYEYLLFRKPLVLYVPDLDEYRSRRGFYMNIEEIPGQIVSREQELADAVMKAAEQKAAGMRLEGQQTADTHIVKRQPEEKKADENSYRKELDSFLARYMGACDGKATDRIAEWMLRKRITSCV